MNSEIMSHSLNYSAHKANFTYYYVLNGQKAQLWCVCMYYIAIIVHEFTAYLSCTTF